ncbi:hypothetical protein DSCW_46570 [Desulfosarcina widdelii]|uniref:Uncharacterized protein n=1 Tax=Desulfosarcina widdelii TaxID=947919 RepID=A0A5K7Z8Z2_9BACT|nr:hypothetical protein [Desulfosarcina widdelii]BBO77240.1 hypothetical protein DSCW_46570 [Desulfosarcina widdelii]
MKQAKDPKYIRGIYNYCDRWCERCQFTSRCLNCALTEETFGNLEEIDIRNKEFWEKLSGLFRDTMEMIAELALQKGIDLNSFENENQKNLVSKQSENRISNMLFHLAEEYAVSARRWLQSNKDLLHRTQDQMTRIRLLSSEENPEKEFANIKDSIEVIKWYLFQIGVKIKRASENQCEDIVTKEDDLPDDSDGSAKVALIGIEKSMAAWHILLNNFPEQRKEVIQKILHLKDLRKRTELGFPNARAVKRPGFDDPKEI